MLSSFSRYVLFASSYSPLTLAFAVLYLRSSRPTAVVLFAFAAASVALLVAMLRVVNGMARQPLVVENTARKDSDTLSYLATYLIPFALSPPKDAYELGALAIFVIVLGFLYVNSNMIYINPVLNAMGYHLYEVTPQNSKRTVILLSRTSDDVPELVNVVEISRRIYVAPDPKS